MREGKALGKGTCSTVTLCLDRVNVGCGPAEERVLLTGLHAVADIYCENCKTTLGWKYVSTWLWRGTVVSFRHCRFP